MTAFLDPSTVAGIRNAAAGLFWDTAIIQTRNATTTKKGYGDQVESFTAASTSTPCKLNIADSGETQDWQELAKLVGSITFPTGTTIANEDRISFTHRYGSALAAPILFLVSGEPYESLLGIVAPVEVYPK